jgi:predicted metal-binding membrane protein
MSFLAPRTLPTPSSPYEREAATVSARPVSLPAVAAILALTLGAWAALALQAQRVGGENAFLTALCSSSGASPGEGVAGLVSDWAASAAIFAVMSVAMMLPTLIPTAASYLDRADEHLRRTGAGAASSLWLIGGYLLVWTAVSVSAGLAQALWLRLGSQLAAPPVITGVLSGAVIGAAGLYQFSDLKLRFLAACRHEVDAESASGSRLRVFRLGLAHGARCVGCCAAVMALMLIAGVMNLFWMACFTLLMTIERLTQGRWAPRMIGAGLVMAGAAVAISAVGIGPVLHWALG